MLCVYFNCSWHAPHAPTSACFWFHLIPAKPNATKMRSTSTHLTITIRHSTFNIQTAQNSSNHQTRTKIRHFFFCFVVFVFVFFFVIVIDIVTVVACLKPTKIKQIDSDCLVLIIRWQCVCCVAVTFSCFSFCWSCGKFELTALSFCVGTKPSSTSSPLYCSVFSLAHRHLVRIALCLSDSQQKKKKKKSKNRKQHSNSSLANIQLTHVVRIVNSCVLVWCFFRKCANLPDVYDRGERC